MNMSKCKHSPNCRNVFWNDFSKNRSVFFVKELAGSQLKGVPPWHPMLQSLLDSQPWNHWEKSNVRRFCWRWKPPIWLPKLEKTYSKVVEIYYTLSRWEPWQTKLFLWVWDQPGWSSTKQQWCFWFCRFATHDTHDTEAISVVDPGSFFKKIFVGHPTSILFKINLQSLKRSFCLLKIVVTKPPKWIDTETPPKAYGFTSPWISVWFWFPIHCNFETSLAIFRFRITFGKSRFLGCRVR